MQSSGRKVQDLANPKKKHKVNGDLTKVRWATCLNDAGRRLLQNLEHVSSQIPGTMEIRKIMRYATHAGRIRRGVPIFVTWSPDEKHNALMMRLSCSCVRDPLNQLDEVSQKFGGIDQPSITLSAEEIAGLLPEYDDRRAMLARDGLASVEGVRLSILIVREYFFGM